MDGDRVVAVLLGSQACNDLSGEFLCGRERSERTGRLQVHPNSSVTHGSATSELPFLFLDSFFEATVQYLLDEAMVCNAIRLEIRLD